MELDITFGQRMAMIVTFFIYTVAIVAVSLWAKRSMDKAAGECGQNLGLF